MREALEVLADALVEVELGLLEDGAGAVGVGGPEQAHELRQALFEGVLSRGTVTT